MNIDNDTCSTPQAKSAKRRRKMLERGEGIDLSALQVQGFLQGAGGMDESNADLPIVEITDLPIVETSVDPPASSSSSSSSRPSSSSSSQVELDIVNTSSGLNQLYKPLEEQLNTRSVNRDSSAALRALALAQSRQTPTGQVISKAPADISVIAAVRNLVITSYSLDFDEFFLSLGEEVEIE